MHYKLEKKIPRALKNRFVLLKNKRILGVTILETLIIVTILVVLSLLGINFLNFQKEVTQFNRDSTSVLTSIKSLRNRSINMVSDFGGNFESRPLYYYLRVQGTPENFSLGFYADYYSFVNDQYVKSEIIEILNLSNSTSLNLLCNSNEVNFFAFKTKTTDVSFIEFESQKTNNKDDWVSLSEQQYCEIRLFNNQINERKDIKISRNGNFI